jgi:hypothetical protein
MRLSTSYDSKQRHDVAYEIHFQISWIISLVGVFSSLVEPNALSASCKTQCGEYPANMKK